MEWSAFLSEQNPEAQKRCKEIDMRRETHFKETIKRNSEVNLRQAYICIQI